MMTKSLPFHAATRLIIPMWIDELPSHIFEEMVHFFKVYKELEHKSTAVDEIQNAKAAKEIIAKDIDNYIETFCK